MAFTPEAPYRPSGILTNTDRRRFYGGQGITKDEFVTKVGRYVGACGQANRKATMEAAGVYKDGVLKAAKRDVGNDGAFGNWGKNRQRKNPKPLRLGAGYDVRGYENAVALLKARPAGAWKVLEYGTQAHPLVAGLTKKQRRVGVLFGQLTGEEVSIGTFIGGRRGSREVNGVKRRRSSLALKLPDGNFRFGVRHPGARAKKTWSRGIEASTEGAMRTYRAAHTRALVEIFGR